MSPTGYKHGINRVYHDKAAEDKDAKETRKQLFIVEDYLNNIYGRVKDLLGLCKLNSGDDGVVEFSLDYDDRNFNAYQNSLLTIEVVYQYVEGVIRQNKANRVIEDELKKMVIDKEKSLERGEMIRERLVEENEKKQNEVHAMKTQLKQLRKVNETKEEEIFSLKEELEVVGGLKNKAEVESKMLLEENKKLKSTEQKIQEQIIELTEQNKKTNSKVSSLQNLTKKLKSTIQKKSREIEICKKEIENYKRQNINYDQTTTQKPKETIQCYCQVSLDVDGILEENQRLWDAYNQAYNEYVKIEQEINRLKRLNDKEISSERQKSNLSNSKERLTSQNLLLQSKIAQLINYVEENEIVTKQRDEKFYNLQDKLSEAQDLLAEYKVSFIKMEQLLQDQNEEYERKLVDVKKTMCEEKRRRNEIFYVEDNNEINDEDKKKNYGKSNDNDECGDDQLKKLLSNPTICSLIETHMKIQEFEDVIDGFLDGKIDLFDAKIDLFNYEDYRAVREEIVELKWRIDRLKKFSEGEMSKIVEIVEDELEVYKFAFVGNEEDSDDEDEGNTEHQIDEIYMILEEAIY